MHIIVHQPFRKPIIRLSSNYFKILSRTSSIQGITNRLINILLFFHQWINLFRFLDLLLFIRIRVHWISLHLNILLDLLIVLLELPISELLDGWTLVYFRTGSVIEVASTIKKFTICKSWEFLAQLDVLRLTVMIAFTVKWFRVWLIVICMPRSISFKLGRVWAWSNVRLILSIDFLFGIIFFVGHSPWIKFGFYFLFLLYFRFLSFLYTCSCLWRH